MKETHAGKIKTITSIGWIVFGITFLIRYYKTGDSFLLWAGLFISIAHAISLVLHLGKQKRGTP